MSKRQKTVTLRERIEEAENRLGFAEERLDEIESLTTSVDDYTRHEGGGIFYDVESYLSSLAGDVEDVVAALDGLVAEVEARGSRSRDLEQARVILGRARALLAAGREAASEVRRQVGPWGESLNTDHDDAEAVFDALNAEEILRDALDQLKEFLEEEGV